MADKEQKVHESPRLSTNQLAAYCTTASATARRTIIRAAKYPGYGRTYYTRTRALLKQWLLEGASDNTIITDRLDELREILADDEDRSLIANNIMALERIDSLNCLSFDQVVEVLSPPSISNRIDINGVSVNVLPSVLTRIQQSNRAKNPKKMAAIMPIFSQSLTVNQTFANVVSYLMVRYIEEHDLLEEDEVSAIKYCQVIDIFEATCFTGPGGTTQVARQVGFACDEIARAWPDV